MLMTGIPFYHLPSTGNCFCCCLLWGGSHAIRHHPCVLILHVNNDKHPIHHSPLTKRPQYELHWGTSTKWCFTSPCWDERVHLTFYLLSSPCSGDHPGVYVFLGERISLVFLIIRELTGRLAVEMEREEQVMEEYEGGICINISARVLELMQCECHVTCVRCNML